MSAIISTIIQTIPKLRVLHMGQGEGCLFLHGIGGNAQNWLRQLEHFSHYFHSIAWDARGYGESEDYDGALTFADLCNDILRIIEHFSYRQIHLVGLSMGGAIAFDFYHRFPDRVKSLTICSATIGINELSEETIDAFLKSRQTPLLNGLDPKHIAEDVADGLIGKNATAESREELVASLSSLRKQSYLKAIEAVARHRMGLDPAEIDVPIHLVAAEDDQLITVEDMVRLSQRIPSAELTIIPNAGHLSNIENPLYFNAAVLTFLHRLGAGKDMDYTINSA